MKKICNTICLLIGIGCYLTTCQSSSAQAIDPPCPKEKTMVFAGFDYYTGCACPGCTPEAVLMAYASGTNPLTGCGANNKCNTDVGPAGLMQGGGGGGGVGMSPFNLEVFTSKNNQKGAEQGSTTTADNGDFVWKNGPVEQSKKYTKDLEFSPQVAGFTAKACELDSKYRNGVPGFAKAGNRYFILYRLKFKIGSEEKHLNIGAEIDDPTGTKVVLYTDTEFNEKTGILKIKDDGRLKGFEFTVSVSK